MKDTLSAELNIEKMLCELDRRSNTCKKFSCDRIYSVSEVAGLLFVDNARIHRLFDEGKLTPDFKSDKQFYFTRETIIVFYNRVKKSRDTC